jgi:hypothetical protein
MLRDDAALGYPKRSLAIIGAGKRYVEDWYESIDQTAAEAVDAIISGLDPHLQAAIGHFNLAAVWRFQRLNVEDVYYEALGILERELPKRGLY